MCIAVPMKVIEINGEMGTVERFGVKRQVGLILLDNVDIGDFVLIHAGYAISKLNEEEAKETEALLRQAKLIE